MIGKPFVVKEVIRWRGSKYPHGLRTLVRSRDVGLIVRIADIFPDDTSVFEIFRGSKVIRLGPYVGRCGLLGRRACSGTGKSAWITSTAQILASRGDGHLGSEFDTNTYCTITCHHLSYLCALTIGAKRVGIGFTRKYSVAHHMSVWPLTSSKFVGR